jgi:hypothetical protein
VSKKHSRTNRLVQWIMTQRHGFLNWMDEHQSTITSMGIESQCL